MNYQMDPEIGGAGLPSLSGAVADGYGQDEPSMVSSKKKAVDVGAAGAKKERAAN